MIIISILMVSFGWNTTLFECVDVWPEGAGDFQGSGGDRRSSTTNNRAEVVTRREGARRQINSLISKIINYYQQK
jgi:hypothetical protein